MARAAWVEIPTASIVVGPRLRQVDPAAVENLKVSIEESGWFGSILVRPLPGAEGKAAYALVAGAHRLAAVRALGRGVIAATIRPLTDDEAEQIEIDENLVRRGLTPLERAEMVLARLTVWKRRFPDRVQVVDGAEKLKRGRPSNSANFAEFLGGTPHAMGFAEETAGEIGLGETTIKNALRTVNGLTADLRSKLHGTWIAKNEGALRQLAAIADKGEQERVAAQLLEGKTKSVSDAIALAAGNQPTKSAQTPIDTWLKDMKKAFKSAPPGGQDALLDWLAGQPLPGSWTVRKAGTNA